jgi:UDP-glucose 4-epimerase
VYGPHQLTEGEYCTVLGIFQKQFKEGVELTITGDGEQRRDFTHVFDIVDGFIKAGENIDKSNGETFELGRGENFSINVIAQSFDCGYTYIPERKGEMRETLCTDMKARELLGWKPTIDVLDYIEGIRVDNEISNN